MTFDITASIRAWCRARQGTVVAALLQATPEVYALYDDVILLREGRIVYHGPREALPPYMAGIGFPPPIAPPAPIALPPAGTATRAASDGTSAESAAPPQEDVADWLLSVITHPHGAHMKAKASAAAAAASLRLGGASSGMVGGVYASVAAVTRQMHDH